MIWLSFTGILTTRLYGPEPLLESKRRLNVLQISRPITLDNLGEKLGCFYFFQHMKTSLFLKATRQHFITSWDNLKLEISLKGVFLAQSPCGEYIAPILEHKGRTKPSEPGCGSTDPKQCPGHLYLLLLLASPWSGLLPLAPLWCTLRSPVAFPLTITDQHGTESQRLMIKTQN